MHGTPTTIMKCDALGRIGYPRGQREALLDEFERSGLKGAAFARTVGISYATFASWIQKRRHARGDDYGGLPAPGRVVAKPVAPRWLGAGLVPGPVRSPAHVPLGPAAPLSVELPCGTRLLVGDALHATLAARLLQALQTPAPPAPC
jgi:hypothetical protein